MSYVGDSQFLPEIPTAHFNVAGTISSPFDDDCHHRGLGNSFLLLTDTIQEIPLIAVLWDYSESLMAMDDY